MEQYLSKIELRRRIREKRTALTPEQLESGGKAATDKLRQNRHYNEANSIFCYLSFAGEVETKYIIEAAQNDGKTVYVPVTECSKMFACKYLEPLKKDRFGINIPEKIEIASAKPDIAIIPGLAFDSELNRIGFGLGFYDRYLVRNSMHAIGLCYDFQYFGRIEAAEFDVKMNEIIVI